MALNLREYFDLRTIDTLEALGNMRVLFEDLRQHATDSQLLGILHRQYEVIQADLRALAQITNRPVPDIPAAATSESANEADERFVVVGRTWTGTIGRSMVEHYRIYVTSIPQYLIDVNAAMLAEEVCHFNLGNFTGLIVLAKEVDAHEAADLLQACIDRQTQLRLHIENALWQIVGRLHQQEERKAA